jgi:hypothetical protein
VNPSPQVTPAQGSFVGTHETLQVSLAPHAVAAEVVHGFALHCPRKQIWPAGHGCTGLHT